MPGCVIRLGPAWFDATVVGKCGTGVGSTCTPFMGQSVNVCSQQPSCANDVTAAVRTLERVNSVMWPRGIGLPLAQKLLTRQ
jgi:hypothetical protein